MSYYILNRNCYPQTCALTSNKKFINPYDDIYLINYRKQILNKKKEEKEEEKPEKDDKDEAEKKKKEKKKKEIMDSIECPTCS
jgi:hypothetical protein